MAASLLWPAAGWGQEAAPAAGASPEATEAPEEPEKPEKPEKRASERPFETSNLETPVFPDEKTYRIGDAFRFRAESRFVPSGNFGGFDADLYRPELRLRITAPLSSRAVLQFTGRFGASLYDWAGDLDPLGTGANSDPFDNFYRASLGLQGGFRINRTRSLFVEGEMWSVLGVVFGRARWEEGAFWDGINGGGSVALAYEIDDLIRIAVGVAVQSRIDRTGVRVSPVADLKWEPTPNITVRNRGQGLQLEYAFSRKFAAFATGFLETDRFRLDDQPGLPDDLTFRDRAVFAGLGFEWKISRHFRLNVEGGAVAWRELRVKAGNDGTLFEENATPSAYFDVRFEIRP